MNNELHLNMSHFLLNTILDDNLISKLMQELYISKLELKSDDLFLRKDT